MTFCSSKCEAEHFAHGAPSKRKIHLKLCLGTGIIALLWTVSITGCFWKPVDMNLVLVLDSGIGRGPVKLAILSRLF